MIAFIIILCVAVLLVALLSVRGRVVVEYGETLSVRVTILGVTLFCRPKKKKKVNVDDYTPRKLARLRRREAAKQARRAKKQAKKNQRKQKKQQSASPAPEKKKGLVDNLGVIRQLLTVVFSRFTHHVKLRATRIIIKVATDDAAKTAILFGAVNQAVAAIIEILDSAGKLQGLKSSRILVAPDFTAEKTSADIHIVLSLRVWHMLDILLRAAWRFVKRKGSGSAQD